MHVSWHRTNPQIARLMGISVSAVKRHMERMLPKFRVQDRRELGALARALVLQERENER
jgi:DNA-binding CsgD family transcriptional regulator